MRILEGLCKAKFETFKTDEFKESLEKIYTEERKKIINLFDLDDQNLDKIFKNDFLAKNRKNVHKLASIFLDYNKLVGSLPSSLTDSITDLTNRDYKWVVITLPQ